MRCQAQPTSATASSRPPGAAGKSLARAGPRAVRCGAGAARSAAASALEGRASTLAPLPQQPLWHGGARSMRARAGGDGAEGASAAATPTALIDGPLRLELDTAEARRSLRFDVAPMGQGQAIIVVDVAHGSEADEAGVMRGMRLTAISDPIRRDEVWKLQDRPSLKNIRELFKMRSADTITVEFSPWDGPVPTAAQGGSLSMAPVTSSTDSSAPSSALSSLDSDGGALPGESIGDRLQRQYAAAAASGRTPTAVEKRQARRREAMAISDARDDRPLLLGLFAMFALPPLLILGIAYSTGYLDQLYTNTLTGLR